MGEIDQSSRLRSLIRKIDSLQQSGRIAGDQKEAPWAGEPMHWHELHCFWRQFPFYQDAENSDLQKLGKEFSKLIRDEKIRYDFPHRSPSADAYLALMKAHAQFLLSGYPDPAGAESAQPEADGACVPCSSPTDLGEALYQERIANFAEADRGRYVIIDLESGGQVVENTIPSANRAFVAAFGTSARGFVRRIGGQRGDF